MRKIYIAVNSRERYPEKHHVERRISDGSGARRGVAASKRRKDDLGELT
jgi:hypothetical protein